MPECYNFAANYLLFGRIEKKINIQLKQKKKMILSYNTHYHLFLSYHCSERNTTSFVFLLKAAIKKSP